MESGDGYQASNERRLVFGLGAENQVDELQICWRSGQIDKFRGFSSNTEWVVIESIHGSAISKMVQIKGRWQAD